MRCLYGNFNVTDDDDGYFKMEGDCWFDIVDTSVGLNDYLI